MSRDQKSSTEIKGYDLSDNNRVDQNGGLKQGLLKDGQESLSKIYKLFFRRYMPKPH